MGSTPGQGRYPGGGQPTPVYLPGESHGQRSLVSYSSQGHEELDTTEATQHACTHTQVFGDKVSQYSSVQFFFDIIESKYKLQITGFSVVVIILKTNTKKKSVDEIMITVVSEHSPQIFFSWCGQEIPLMVNFRCLLDEAMGAQTLGLNIILGMYVCEDASG